MTTSHDERQATNITSTELSERAVASGWTWGPIPDGFLVGVVRWHRHGHSIHGDVDAPGEAFRSVYGDSVLCSTCGAWVEMNYHQSSRMRSLGECFVCHLWLERSRRFDSQEVALIDQPRGRGRSYYTVGNRTGPSDCLGFGGQRFDIAFVDGRKVTTHDLWFGGEVPERFLDLFPANASFQGG